ncbi:hypothetical protein [Neptunomonas qingdaonensis]|uniref:ATP-binding protein n=1 Tax=Neptunomonas qingdaonensis TaxID=1045558 RepID=A0A1I2MWS1_9GAMM|nr:hypothetical protein [Neptunomonas qingdaonensis]SFF95922.1 hypothetical protein SAMN05216175_102146 [Neptunomonas qingdaonensis]
MSSEEDYTGESKVERVVNYVIASARLGVDSHERPYAVLDGTTGNPVALSVYGKEFASWVRHSAYTHGDLLKKEDVGEVQSSLAAYAEFEGEEMVINQRVGRSKSGGLEIDIADKDNTRVVVEPGSVRIVSDGSGMLFSRSNTTMALPIPAEGGDWRQLLPFLNMTKDDKLQFIGCMTYILSHPRDKTVGYPIMVIKGEQGAGKSFLCKSILRALVDPNANGIQMIPSDPKELAISSLNRYLLVLENIRELKNTWSDALCVAATGGTLFGRKLYSDHEEASVNLHAPVVLNGIHNFIQETDLASRCVTFNLLVMPPDQRRQEKQLLTELNRLLPTIFRGLLDLIADIMEVQDSAKVIYPQRMISYVHWLAAMECALELPAGQIQKSYAKNQQRTMLDTIQEDQLAFAVLKFAKQHKEQAWSGSPTQLLQQLTVTVPPRVTNSTRTWPQSAISLSKRLATLQKALSAQGVLLQLGERGKHRRIVVGMEAGD